jgi:hypothetical protein
MAISDYVLIHERRNMKVIVEIPDYCSKIAVKSWVDYNEWGEIYLINGDKNGARLYMTSTYFKEYDREQLLSMEIDREVKIE